MKDGTSAELNDKFDPDHHLSILSNLIQRTEKPPDFVNGLRYQYARIVKNFGVKVVEEQILGSLEKDLRHLIGTRRLDFETVKSCNKSKAQSCVRPGVYIHVIYDPADSDYIGVYIGSALYIGPRIRMHIRDFKAARNRKKKRRRNTLHIDFWSRRPGIRDFWLVFGQLKTRDDNDEELAFLLNNILEMYAMLLFRTLPLQILRGNLPKGSKTNPYLWTGLNVADPMKQYREGLWSSITRKQHHFNLRPPAFRNISYRDANPSKGDKLRVELICYRCRNPQSYFVDQYPRYEIASGKYLTWVSRWCYYCLSGPVRFIPVDKSLPRKSFGAVQYQHRKEKAKNSPLGEMTKLEVLAWLASKGFRGNTVNWLQKHELVSLAEGVWDYLAGPQDQEAKLTAVETDIPASRDFSISLSFSTQLQHHQTTTNIKAIYIIVSASASSI
jgi:hypothetical protein